MRGTPVARRVHVQQPAQPAKLRLRPAQARVFRSKARHKVVVAGRRFGKSYLALVWLLTIALAKPFALCYYVSPTYRMSRDIAWELLKRLAPPSTVAQIHENRLAITFINGSRIVLKGADNPDSLRGVGLDAVVLDEYATMDPRTWTEVLRPALSDKQGVALFIGTPKGFNHFHAIWQSALEEKDKTGHWDAWQFTTADGGNVPLEEIEAAKRDLTDKQFNQEYLASFEALTSRVYYAFNRSWNVRKSIVHDPNLPVLCGVDFNVSPGMHAVLGQRVGGQLHIFDEIFIADGNTEELAREVVKRYGLVNGRKRKLIAFPDPTGKRRQTNAPIGVTDHSILRNYGFEIRSPHAPYASEDKYNTANAALRTASGRTLVFIHPGCRRLISALEGFTYKEETGQPDLSGGLDHITDAYAYLVCYEFPMEANVIMSEGMVV